MRVEIVTDFPRLEELSREWERLWRADERREIFTTFAWARASWRAYGSTRSVYSPVVFDGDRVVAILPLVVERNILRFMGTPRSDYNDLLREPMADPSILDVVLRSLWGAPQTWRYVLLENISERSVLMEHISQLSPRVRARIHVSFSSRCPTLLFGGKREEVVASMLKKKSLRRHANKLRRVGEVRFQHLRTREEIAEHLPAFFDQHIRRSASKGDNSLFEDGRARTFYKALLNELDPERELRFGLLEVSGRPVAYHFGFEVNGKFLWYKPAFDIEFGNYSPGEVLLKQLFEYVRCRPLSEFDFTIGEEAFKARFTNHLRRNSAVYFFPQGLRGRVRCCLYRLKHFIKALAKDRTSES